jgi:DNA-binding Lrp family transcriptional regulator
LKDVELKLIAELMKNCRRSDRELAKAIGSSQPTVSRTIKKLEKEGYLEYAAIPNLVKLGYEIVAINIGKRDYEAESEVPVQKANDFIKKHPNMLFISKGQGSDGDRIEISVHRSYSDYAKFTQEAREEFGGAMTTSSFLINLKGNDIIRNLSFKQMAERLKERKG